MLEIEVIEIRGSYPMYKVGDKLTIKGPRIVLEKDKYLESDDILSTLSLLSHPLQQCGLFQYSTC
ncbi:MAG: hypothetical protein QW149_05535 [Nitrososphaerota archaeon]